MSTRRELKSAFSRYFNERINRARAITPGQKIELIKELRRELNEEGRIPLPSGPIKIDPKHPIIKAALSGKNIAMGEGASNQTAETYQDKMQSLPIGVKIASLVLMLFIPIILAVAYSYFSFQSTIAEVVILPTVIPTGTATQTATQTAISSPAATATATTTPEKTPTPVIIQITPTAYAFSLSQGQAPSNNDPASIEVAGFSYILGTGRIQNGSWNPKGAEWLEESDIRRIVGLPYDPVLANALAVTGAGHIIKIRLRSGEIMKYKIAEKLRVQRQQIEVLAGKTPSLAVFLHGETSPERTVIIANAVQEPQDFNIYSIDTTEAKPLPTLAPTNIETVITSTQTYTNTFADLTLSIKECKPTRQVGSLRAVEKQNLYACQITLTANQGSLGTSYSEEFFGITDQIVIESTTDWVPELLGTIPNALGSGRLSAGDSKEGQVVGFTTSDSPVLIWQQAGQRIIIQIKGN